MRLRQYNPFSPILWAMLTLSFIAGYFTQGILSSIKKAQQDYNICHFPKP